MITTSYHDELVIEVLQGDHCAHVVEWHMHVFQQRLYGVRFGPRAVHDTWGRPESRPKWAQ